MESKNETIAGYVYISHLGETVIECSSCKTTSPIDIRTAFIAIHKCKHCGLSLHPETSNEQ